MNQPRALIVEDEITCRMVLETILKSYLECDFAENGRQAVDLFREAVQQEKPYALIFLDIMMPEMNGQQALSMIRDYEQKLGITPDRAVKVIVTSGLDDEENKFGAHVSGCDAYLVKPLSRADIIEELKNLLLV